MGSIFQSAFFQVVPRHIFLNVTDVLRCLSIQGLFLILDGAKTLSQDIHKHDFDNISRKTIRQNAE